MNGGGAGGIMLRGLVALNDLSALCAMIPLASWRSRREDGGCPVRRKGNRRKNKCDAFGCAESVGLCPRRLCLLRRRLGATFGHGVDLDLFAEIVSLLSSLQTTMVLI